MLIKTKYTRANGTIGVKTHSDQPSKTNPNYKDEVDVNQIMDRFLKTGQWSHVSNQPLQYVDYSQIPPDLQSSIHHIKNMENLYNTLNKKTKNRFKSVEEFLAFAENPANQEELDKILSNKTTTSQTTTNKSEELPPSTPPPSKTPTEPVKEKT